MLNENGYDARLGSYLTGAEASKIAKEIKELGVCRSCVLAWCQRITNYELSLACVMRNAYESNYLRFTGKLFIAGL